MYKYIIIITFLLIGIISIFIFNQKKDENGNQDISGRTLKILFGGIIAIAAAIGLLYRVINGIP